MRIGERASARRHDPQAGGPNGELESGFALMNFSIGVERASGWAFHNEARASSKKDARLPVDAAGEQADQHWDGIEKLERWNRAQIQQAIVGAGAGSDQSIVAVLITIRDGQGERENGGAFFSMRDHVRFGCPPIKRAETGGKVPQKSPLLELIETFRNVSLKTNSRCREERPAIDVSGVDQSRFSGYENVQSVRHGSMNAEMTAETIARTTGHQTENGS